MDNIYEFCESTLKWFGRRRYLDWVPDRVYIKLMYYFREKKKIDLDNPKSLNEKLQWLKLYDRKPIYTDMVDKLKAKQIVQEKFGTDLIIKTLGVWDDPNSVDFDMLPNKFVLKTNHDSHSLIICKNKELLDRNIAIKMLKKSFKQNGFWYGREWPYKNVVPKIFAEQYMENNDGSPLVDYKFYCYGGKPIYFMCSYGEAIHDVKNHKFNMKLDSIDYLFKKEESISASEIELPNNINEMIQIVEELCVGFKHIRIDLYNVDGRILFGEFTFYSSAGFINIASQEYSDYLASLITIT